MKLSDYAISRERGFLAPFAVETVELPSEFGAAGALARELPGLLNTGRVRRWIAELDDAEIEQWVRAAPEAEVRVAMVRYGFLAQAWVWGEAQVAACLPAAIARPLVALADRLGQPPILAYSGYVLDNWTRIDPEGPITLDNIAMVQRFDGGTDENWFAMIHAAIEAAAGPLLDGAARLVDIAAQRDEAAAERVLMDMDAAWGRVYGVFARMAEHCDPYVYFHRVRPYMHGWAGNPALPDGLIYEGVERFGGTPQQLRGPTGTQSAIIAAMDAAFGVDLGDDPLAAFLDELHHYRPPQHRRFVEDLRARSQLRAFVVDAGSSTLGEAFNVCIAHAVRFRTHHLEYAARYINKQASSSAGNDPEVGTGGTPFMKFLKQHRDSNAAALVDQ